MSEHLYGGPESEGIIDGLRDELRRVTTLANSNAQKCSDLADENARLRAILETARDVLLLSGGRIRVPNHKELMLAVVDRIDAALGESK